MRIQAQDSMLLVVDIQTRLLPAIHEGESVLSNATWLVDVAQTLKLPVLATEQYPQGLGLTEQSLRARFPATHVIEKIHFSAVTKGALLAHPEANKQQWIVVGTEAHVCVQQTVLDLLARDLQVFVVAEAVGSRKPQDKALALDRMRQNGAEIVSREMVVFEWLEKANTPEFREVLTKFLR
ncbi:MAG TPA: hydrolase [Thiolinea sp.]|nr:hydrolase [Thiolinea sp.]